MTGSRADYGPLKPLLDELRSDRDVLLQIVATGAHISREFGNTYRAIEDDGFLIREKVDIHLDSDTSLGISRSMGFALTGLAEAYDRLRPDLVVLLGDRYEIFAAAAAAVIARIPIVHICGGELTEGAFDESWRHAITKMSNIHLVATDEYRRRVIQMGESPDTVFTIGEIGLDNIRALRLLSKKALEAELGFSFNKKNLLVTFHPVTLEAGVSKAQFRGLLGALADLRDTNVIFTQANADPDRKVINGMIRAFVARNPRRYASFVSMGQRNYLSVMKYVDGVVGNSSSGIIEAPSFRIGTVNIGDRQKGRIRAASVIDCAPKKMAIRSALKRLYSQDFKRVLQRVINPYGDGHSAARAKEILKKHDLKDILKKKFYDCAETVGARAG